MTNEKKTVIAIVAPSGYALDPHAVGRATERLEAAGCRVRNFYDAAATHQRFGGTDAARIAQVHAAADDPEVDMVIALRGGYGLSRLLPMLDVDLLASSGKLFVGHSDFTALQMALLAHSGVPSFAGPMICNDFANEEPSEYTLSQFWKCVRNPVHSIEFASVSAPLDVSGMLWGGNLTMIAHLAGTPWMPYVEDGILFIEDINEHPYRIERMLLQLFHSGMPRQKAIVFGDMSGYRLADFDNGYTMDSMIAYLQDRFGVPMLTGLPFGHMRDKTTLAVGAKAHLQADGKKAMLAMSGYPILA